MKKGIKGLILLFIFMFTAAACNQRQTPMESNYKSGTVTIAGRQLQVEIADTESARANGLSGRDSLSENDGMLFVFPAPGRYSFWMKDMNFPLDFIWIKDNTVIEISNNVLAQPNIPIDGLSRYFPQTEFDSVVEVNAGWAEKNRLKIGDTVTVDRP